MVRRIPISWHPQRNQIERDSAHQQPQDLPPPTPPIAHQQPADDQRQYAGCRTYSRLEIFNSAVSLLTLIVLFWYACVTQGLLNEANRANDTTEDALKSTTASVRLDQRAWIAVSGIADMHYTVREEPRYKLKYRNVGRTPGRIVETSFKLIVDLPSGLPVTPQYNIPHQSNLMVFPNAPASTTIVEKYRITQEVWDTILSGHNNLFVYGYIKYVDIFEEPHWTGFIYAFDSRMKMMVDPPYPNYVYAY